ncbi:hypothetical protein LAWI1_G003905 [Lachnellula willkommii]|uniref:Uncharacterized protein n=1 Tax=Lachnellula willkommii TaxID=215461 RepID=A0A559M795_9HELO|nr:hypothetical protein LAWI1_G003905 [Lachnellula willkommii]
MENVNEDQERMLRCWASTNGKRRPGKKVKAFLGLAQGLSGEQIDQWWENLQTSESNEESLHQIGQSHPPNAPAAQLEFMELDAPDQSTPGAQLYPGHFPYGVDMNDNFRSSAIDTQAWSPIGVTVEDDTLFTIPVEGSVQANPWSPTVCSHGGIFRSSASSLESCPLLSPPGHQSHDSIDRSSYGSSLQTWDTASTLASVYDPCLDDSTIEDFETQIAQTINPIRLSKGKALSSSGFSMSQTILEEASPFHEHMITYPKDRGNEKNGPPVPPKPSKGQGIYHCTKHRFHECTNKPHSSRTWLRKDKLRQHLQQVHALSKDSRGWESWHRDPTKKKRAWGCGFCGACSFTWDALVGSTPNSDRSLEWSKDNAKILKQKLEFHEGSAVEIATEARMLASNFNVEIDSMGWTNPASRVPTLASPIDFGDTEKGGWRHTSPTMMSQGSSFQEPATHFDVPRGIPNFI